VVLTPTPECGDGALAVRDIPEGSSPKLPATWPGVPIFLDSPGFSPVFDGPEVVVNVGFAQGVDLSSVAYDVHSLVETVEIVADLCATGANHALDFLMLAEVLDDKRGLHGELTSGH